MGIIIYLNQKEILGEAGKKIPPLLGREEFFDKFKITFEQSKTTVHLTPVNEHPY